LKMVIPKLLVAAKEPMGTIFWKAKKPVNVRIDICPKTFPKIPATVTLDTTTACSFLAAARLSDAAWVSFVIFSKRLQENNVSKPAKASETRLRNRSFSFVVFKEAFAICFSNIFGRKTVIIPAISVHKTKLQWKKNKATVEVNVAIIPDNSA